MSNSLTARRAIKSGITNFFRNIWVSVAATSMVAITLFIISTIIVLYTLTALSIKNSTDNVGSVTAYFNSRTTDSEIQSVILDLQSLPGVREVIYITKDEARKLFEETHKDNPFLLESINEFEDPVPASVSVRTTDLKIYPEVFEAVQSERYAAYFVDDLGTSTVRDNQKVIDKLYTIINFITTFGVILAVIFMIVTMMVTLNTIRLTIYSRREEVEIMRLVGATNWYIRWPFIIEGVLYAVFATTIISAIVFGLLYLLSSRIEQFLSLHSLGTSLINALFWRILVINIIASVTLCVIASNIAIRKYLRI